MSISRHAIYPAVGALVPDSLNNVFDLAPPFVNGGENGYDVQTANIKGRTCMRR